MPIPKSIQAIEVRAPNDFFIDSAAPVPAVRPVYLLIKIISVTLNPTDWKRVTNFRDEEPCTVGCDVAGRVLCESVGIQPIGDQFARK